MIVYLCIIVLSSAKYLKTLNICRVTLSNFMWLLSNKYLFVSFAYLHSSHDFHRHSLIVSLSNCGLYLSAALAHYCTLKLKQEAVDFSLEGNSDVDDQVHTHGYKFDALNPFCSFYLVNGTFHSETVMLICLMKNWIRTEWASSDMKVKVRRSSLNVVCTADCFKMMWRIKIV